MTDKKKNIQNLSNKQIQDGIAKKLVKYKNLSFFERYAMFMGVAQLLEFGLKKLLESKYGYTLEEMEKWTLGRTTKELKDNGLRKDFIALLQSVVESRNHIAHDLLADEALMNAVMDKLKIKGRFTKNYRFLDRSIYELEQVSFLFDWTNENDGWN